MKSITVHCRDCDDSQMFRGVDVDAVIAAIDASGWHDQGPEDDEDAVKGHCNGLCPVCWDDEESMRDAEKREQCQIAAHRRWAAYWAQKEDAARAIGDTAGESWAYMKRWEQIRKLDALES